MNNGRKVVASIALGLALAVVAWAVVSRWNGPADGGWFMYSPNADSLSSVPGGGGHTVRTAGAWLAAIAAWFVVSWRLFRSEDQ